jgi:N-acetylglucosaminyldiphosphoundecaprenol N-acetyl-beta-D-mannosaminyltransferase
MVSLLGESIPVQDVIGFPVAALPFKSQQDVILEWAQSGLSKTVCIANVHMLIEAHRDAEFAAMLRAADLIAPDGMPLVWMLRLLGVSRQERVSGPDLMIELCRSAPTTGVSLFFLGSQPAILERIQRRLEQEFPNLKIAGIEPLPFRPMTVQEDEVIVQKLNSSGAGIVLVSLGCPKQERWMSEHQDKIKMVMIGVGGAFPVFAGIHRRAPRLMQRLGLEWFYRLIQEPNRLWKRYSDTIPVFVWLAIKQILGTERMLIRSEKGSAQFKM